MKIDAEVYPSYRRERGGRRKGWRTGSLGEKKLRVRGGSVCVTQPLIKQMLISILPQFHHLTFTFWAAAMACLRVPLHPTFPTQHCSFSSHLSHSSSKANGRKPNSSGNSSTAQQQTEKRQQSQKGLNNKTEEEKPVEPLRSCQLPDRQAPLERAQEAGSGKSNIRKATQCQCFFPQFIMKS